MDYVKILMRVLYLTMNPNRASTTVPTEGWLRLLPARGLEPVVVSRQAGEFHQWVKQQGIPAYEVPMPFPQKTRPWEFAASLLRLRSIIRKHGIQIIHCNEHDIYPIGQYLGRICKIPVAVSIHCIVGREYSEWAFRGRRCPKRIFFLSRGSIKVCRQAFTGIIPEDRWRLLYNGLDLDEVRPDLQLGQQFRREFGLNGEILLGNACRLQPLKQIEHLFSAAAQLSDSNLKVVLAGQARPGEETYAQSLLEEGKRKLGDRLVYVGYLSNIRAMCNALDVFVNTSQEETCSISVLEAMASGCPVVGYPSNSVDEQILPSGGEIVAQDDCDQLTQALSRWVSNREQLAEARVAARKRVEEAFDIRQLAEQLWKEYHEILN